MSKDISKILQEWEYDGSEIMVRLIRGDDGREKVQLRVDLGLLQMELNGRPDGVRPEGHESWLDYYQAKHQSHEARSDDPFELGEEDCLRLWREGVQYYHRYLSFWHLKLYDLCARDTERNLRLFAFVRRFAANERTKVQFDQFRPYVLMMHARAVATPQIERGDFAGALRAIDAGIEGIREFLEEYDQSHDEEECTELSNLLRWREEVLAQADLQPEGEPAIRLEILRRRLQEAVSIEAFEEAARLRDEIRRLSTQG
ncbi:MAG: UvrB/UvrC motif-containing protein [Thermoguttaceae bacterium]|jgi:DNA-binding transcriptional MerR regulator|nr:UvrB/UvrC motif-containing protein [Thermoguttaceae bacterium]